MRKKRVILALTCCATLSLASCHKVCTCIDYGGREHEYTSDEVDAHAGGNCSDMVHFPILNHYSYCHW